MWQMLSGLALWVVQTFWRWPTPSEWASKFLFRELRLQFVFCCLWNTRWGVMCFVAQGCQTPTWATWVVQSPRSQYAEREKKKGRFASFTSTWEKKWCAAKVLLLAACWWHYLARLLLVINRVRTRKNPGHLCRDGWRLLTAKQVMSL